jgi:hypothetical protein
VARCGAEAARGARVEGDSLRCGGVSNGCGTVVFGLGALNGQERLRSRALTAVIVGW